MEWGPRGEIIVPVVKVLFRSLSVILRVSGLEEAEAQNTVMSTIKVTCCCCSTQTTAPEVFSQKECEGERRFCLFNTNSTAKKKHIHTLARILDKHHLHPQSFPGEDQLSEWHQRGNQPNLTELWRHPADKGLNKKDSLTPQAPTLLISLFYLGGSAYWRWSGDESRGPIFCPNRHESMRQNQRVWNKPLVVKPSIGRRLSRSKMLPWFGVRCAHEHNWLPWATLLLGVWMYIQHWGEMFATWETSDFLFGTLSKKKKILSFRHRITARGRQTLIRNVLPRDCAITYWFPPEVTLSIRTWLCGFNPLYVYPAFAINTHLKYGGWEVQTTSSSTIAIKK